MYTALQKYIIESFQEKFSFLKNDNIAIYGIGKNTEVLLENCKDYSICGLMDSKTEEKELWGKPIISCSQAKEKDVKAIVIIARADNVPIIFRRIAEECELYHIPVYDVNGVRLQRDEYKLLGCYKAISRDKLKEKIESVDVVSFDIFDTLITRTFLEPKDVFFYIEKKYAKKLPANFEFAKTRINCELELYQYTNPTIKEIYERMAETSDFPDSLIDFFVETETNEEKNCIVPRSEMVSLLCDVKKAGKIVCCTSDMYLPKEVISTILAQNGVHVDYLFVSCDYKKPKCNGLYEVVKKAFEGQTILHIGDNHASDIECAKQYGIEATFEIPSPFKMLQDSSFAFLFDKANSFDERKFLGLFISEVFNNPFLFKETEGRCKIDRCYDLGYYLIAPLVSVFVKWLIEKAEEKSIDTLLLGSRDGWLIKSILDLYSKEQKLGFKYYYFYSSRLACTLAGLLSYEDIEKIYKLPFVGTLEEMLLKRFLLPSSFVKHQESESDAEYFRGYCKLILNNAKTNKNNYLKYISSLKIEEDKLGFFDFVSSGTCQMWLEKIMKKKMYGLYFSRTLLSEKEYLNIDSLVGPKNIYEKQSMLYKYYIFLETIFTSPESSLLGFDNDGKPVFDEESRSEDNILDLNDIQAGIENSIEQNFLLQSDISIEFAEAVLSLAGERFNKPELDFLMNNVLIDEFCNNTYYTKQFLE